MGARVKQSDLWRAFGRWRQQPLNRKIGAIRTGAGRRLFEYRYGVDVSGQLDLSELGVAAEGRAFFLPSDWLTVRRTLRRLAVDEDDVIVDFGSGKGRVVLAAARFTPAKRAVGIEIGGELHEQAVRNREAMRGHLGRTEVELLHGDATELVPDDMTIAYLFSPFYGELMDKFVAALLASLERAPRPLRLIYSFPMEHNRLITTGRFQPIDVIDTIFPYRNLTRPDVVVTYLVNPNDGAAPTYAKQAERRLRGAEVWKGPYDPGFELVFPSGDVVTPTDAESST